MPRPSKATERRREIIDATMRAISTHGITQATLERIAEETGMSRGNLRHFAGNRDALLMMAAEDLFYGEGAQSRMVPVTSDLDELLDALFGPEFAEDLPTNTVVIGFIEAARTIPALRALLLKAYVEQEQRVEDSVAACLPQLDPAARTRTARALYALAMGNLFLNDFEVQRSRSEDARRSARLLVDASVGSASLT